jgi:hypothetical protein
MSKSCSRDAGYTLRKKLPMMIHHRVCEDRNTSVQVGKDVPEPCPAPKTFQVKQYRQPDRDAIQRQEFRIWNVAMDFDVETECRKPLNEVSISGRTVFSVTRERAVGGCEQPARAPQAETRIRAVILMDLTRPESRSVSDKAEILGSLEAGKPVHDVQV